MSRLLACEKVSFAYRGGARRALDEVDFTVDNGEFVGVAGSTGAGKSTLILAASGIVPHFHRGPFRGRVAIRGEPIAGKRVADICDRVGTVFQDFESQLFSTNARLECAFGMENIGLDRDTMRRRIGKTAKLVGLEGLLDRDPQTLSGGQKQRLALASVLCLEPELLLCDEPTTDLDPAGRAMLFDVLLQLARKKHGVVLVEHETERLVHADRIYIMHNGRVATGGLPAQVLADPAACLRYGVQPPQLFNLCARLGLPDRPLTMEAARELLSRRGFTVQPGSVFTDHPAPEAAPLIEMRDVGFAYTTGRPALRNVNLAIGRGDFIALLGQNGSGKTTLVKHMNALLEPDAGTVLFEGQSVGHLGTARMGSRIGFVFQNPDHMLFAATVAEEVAFGPRNLKVPDPEITRRVAAALAIVGLSGREKIDPFVMTKGDRQKLAVACVLACEPEVLILDEPTTGLDANEQASMMDLLADLNRHGRTIIIVTHALDVAAAYARRVVLMRDGQIIGDGLARTLLHQTNLLAQADLVAPPCIRLAGALGVPALTPMELAGALERRPA